MRRDLCVNSNLHMDKERMVSKMMNSLIELKECGLPMDDSLRGLRLKKYPLQFDENILIFDRLEPDGILLLYEYTGGGLYLPMTLHELEDCENAILVAGVAVLVFASENWYMSTGILVSWDMKNTYPSCLVILMYLQSFMAVAVAFWI